MRGQVMGMGVFGPAGRVVVAHGFVKVKVHPVHGFRPDLELPLDMPCFMGYFESGISMTRKLSLRHALARPALPLGPQGL
jgi:hypothetical protein